MRLIKLLPLAGLLMLGTPALADKAPPPATLTLERIFASPDLSGGEPRKLKLSPDGALVTVLEPRAKDRERYDLWAIDTTTGKRRMLVDSREVGSGAELSEAERMQRERARIGGLTGIVDYQWAPDGQAILVPLDGDLYLADLKGKTRRLTDTPEGELNPGISPGGGWLTFVRGGNFFVQSLAGKATAQALTTDGGELIHWGEAEFVAQEEMNRHTGYWWSPDDRHIAVARVDERPVGVVSRAAIGADGTRVYAQRYPVAGSPNAIVDLFVFRPEGGAPVQVDLGKDKDVYLARVDWSADGRTLYVQRQSRDQKRLDLIAVDPATGKGRVILTETARTWINLSNVFEPLKDGSFLWWSEKDGYGHLYRVTGDTWVQLTHGEWEVRDLIAVDEAKGLAYVTGNRETPLEQQLYAVPIDAPGDARPLTEAGWWNDAVMDRAATRIIVARSNADHPRQVYLADGTGKRINWLSENDVKASDHPYHAYAADHAPTRFGTLKVKDGTELHWKMLAPDLVPGKRFPVFMIHYGGPGGGRQVTNQWAGVLNQYLVSQGWIVFAIDNRGTPDRGKKFEDHLYHAMGTIEVEDQIAGLDWLQQQAFVDPKRIATYGWSYGGYLTLKLLEKAPGRFAAGVSGAPVTDWTLYDTHYTERYLGMPSGARNAYPAAGALDEAMKIRDPLLLIHGMSDDNVVFDNTTKIMARLQEIAVPFETMVYPGQTHRVGGPKVSVHMWRTILDFLARRGIEGGGK